MRQLIHPLKLRALHLMQTFAAALAALLLTSCDVHEFPTEEPIPPSELNCDFEMVFDRGAMDLLTTIEYGNASDRPSSSSRSRGDGNHDFRYYINVYPEDPETRVPTRTPIDNLVLTVATTPPGFDGEAPDHDMSVRLNLDPGYYRILVWADHVAPLTATDLYYSTSDFAQIEVLRENGLHPGNIPWRDAFRGQVSIRVGSDREVYTDAGDGPMKRIEIPMHRPMARYRIITTDLNEFISRGSAPAAEPDTDPADAPQQAPVVSPNPDDYRVVVRYNGYMPSVYNAHTDRPVNSRLGVWYDGEISRLDPSSAQLASDYVFVNGAQTSVQLVMEVLNRRTGESIASTEPFTVPLSRNRLTLVKGPFLTSKASSGMGIIPDFNGEFNFEVR